MKLDVNMVNPFILATIETMTSMTHLQPQRTGLHLKEKNEHCIGDISGILGFAGDFTGNFAVSMPDTVGLKVVGAMMGEEVTTDSMFYRDGVRELANVIVGKAKAKIYEAFQLRINLSLPTVITGSNHYVAHPSRMLVIIVEYAIDEVGRFAMELCYRTNQGG